MREKESFFTDRNKIITYVSIIILGFIFFMYLSVTKQRLDDYAWYSLNNQITTTSDAIEARLHDARRSIVAASGEVAARWREESVFNVVRLVESIRESYGFDVLEFVDKNGINLMSGANKFDASDREYYKEGIKGKTGLWINFAPKVSNEYLLNFYSPVYYNGEIKGVLVGALGSKTTMKPLTQSSFFGRESIGVLFNEEERALSASFDFNEPTYAKDIYKMFRLTENDMNVFSEHVKSKDGVVFEYEGPSGDGIACVRKIGEDGWGFAIVIPSTSFSSVYGDFTHTGMITIAAILVVVFTYVIYMVGTTSYYYNARIEEDSDIIKGFCKVYHSVFMLDFNKGVARCLRTRDPVAAKFGITEGEEFPYKDVLMKYIYSSSDEGSISKLSSLENVMYVDSMMNNKDYFTIDYKLLNSGNGSLAIAYMGTEGTDNDERYLMGITEKE